MKVKATQKTVERIAHADLKAFQIDAYDVDNLYPQRVINIVNDSGTAKTCLKLQASFLFGLGFSDLNFYKAKINRKGLTVDKLLRKSIRNRIYFNAMAFHINYNEFGEKVEINPVNIEDLRIVSDESKEYKGKIALYDDWACIYNKSIKKEKIKYLYLYDQSAVLEQIKEAGGIENYSGQIFFASHDGVEYQLSPFDSVLEDMQTEAATKYFKHSTATRNFLASHIVVTGKSEKGVDDEGNEYEEENSLIPEIQSMQGGINAGKFIVVEKENENDDIEIKPIQLQNYDGLFEYTENSARDSIIRQFLIPPVLLLQTPGKLGTSSEISDAVNYYNSVISDVKTEIEEVFTELFSNFYPNINPTNNYSILPIKAAKEIDPQYFQYFSEDEIRESIGYQKRQNIINGNIIN